MFAHLVFIWPFLFLKLLVTFFETGYGRIWQPCDDGFGKKGGGGIWSSFHQNGFVGLRVCFLSFRSAVPNQGYWKISRGTPDFHQLKIYTDIFNDNVISHKSLELTRGYTSFIFSAWGYVSRKKVWNRCFRSIYNQLQCIMSQ